MDAELKQLAKELYDTLESECIRQSPNKRRIPREELPPEIQQVDIAGAKFIQSLISRERLKARLDEQYREHIHTHQASNDVTDERCRRCGRDVRHQIHFRVDDERLDDLRDMDRIDELERELAAMDGKVTHGKG